MNKVIWKKSIIYIEIKKILVTESASFRGYNLS
jgi:hypothetical protein